MIPKIIHQTWKNETVPEKWEKSPIQWKLHHPTWTYKLWTDVDNRELIATKFPWFLKTYDFFPYAIQRADAVRYFILYSEGGVYSDLDIYPVQAIDSYISSGLDAYFVSSSNVSSCITNAFMVSTKGAAIWTGVFEEMLKRMPVWAVTKHLAVMMTTGPLMLNRSVNKHAKVTHGFLPRPLFTGHNTTDVKSKIINIDLDTVLVPLEGSSWCGFDSKIINLLNENKVLVIVSLIILFVTLIVLAVLFRYKLSDCRKNCNK